MPHSNSSFNLHTIQKKKVFTKAESPMSLLRTTYIINKVSDKNRNRRLSVKTFQCQTISSIYYLYYYYSHKYLYRFSNLLFSTHRCLSNCRVQYIYRGYMYYLELRKLVLSQSQALQLILLLNCFNLHSIKYRKKYDISYYFKSGYCAIVGLHNLQIPRK